jgi:hypothetical protein
MLKVKIDFISKSFLFTPFQFQSTFTSQPVGVILVLDGRVPIG